MSTGRIDVQPELHRRLRRQSRHQTTTAPTGAAIVFHNDPRGANAIGAFGSGLAVGGIQNGLAIEFDTYNSNAGN